MVTEKMLKVCLYTCIFFYLVSISNSFPAGSSGSKGGGAADALPAAAAAVGDGDVQVRTFKGPTERHTYRVTGAQTVHRYRVGGPGGGGPPGGGPNRPPGGGPNRPPGGGPNRPPGGRPGPGGGPRIPGGGKLPKPKPPNSKSKEKGGGDDVSLPECKDRVTSHEGIVEVILTGAKNVGVGAGTLVRKVLEYLHIAGGYPAQVQKAVAIAVCEGIKGGRDAESIVGQATGLLLNDVGELLRLDPNGPKDVLKGTVDVLKDVGEGLGYIFKDAALGIGGIFKELTVGKR